MAEDAPRPRFTPNSGTQADSFRKKYAKSFTPKDAEQPAADQEKKGKLPENAEALVQGWRVTAFALGRSAGKLPAESKVLMESAILRFQMAQKRLLRELSSVHDKKGAVIHTQLQKRWQRLTELKQEFDDIAGVVFANHSLAESGDTSQFSSPEYQDAYEAADIVDAEEFESKQFNAMVSAAIRATEKESAEPRENLQKLADVLEFATKSHPQWKEEGSRKEYKADEVVRWIRKFAAEKKPYYVHQMQHVPNVGGLRKYVFTQLEKVHAPSNT